MRDLKFKLGQEVWAELIGPYKGLIVEVDRHSPDLNYLVMDNKGHHCWHEEEDISDTLQNT